MILVRRSRLIAAACAIGLVLVVAGFVSYRTVSMLDVMDSKVAAERMLFIGIVSAAGIGLAAASVFLDHIRFARQMETAVSVVRREGKLPQSILRRLGTVGTRVAVLYDELARKNEALRTRVDAQRQLIEFLVKNLDVGLCICDVRGRVLYATPSILREADLTIGEATGQPVSLLLPDVRFVEIVRTLDRTGDVHEDGERRRFYPITDDRGFVSYVVCGRDIELEPHAAARQMTQPRRRFLDRARRLFGRSAG